MVSRVALYKVYKYEVALQKYEVASPVHKGH